MRTPAELDPLRDGRVRDVEGNTPFSWTEMSTLDGALLYISNRHPYETKGGDDDFDAEGFGGRW